MSRHKKNIDILPENWQHDIIKLYAEGGCDVEVKALIYSWLNSLSNDLWDRWILEEPIFSETIKNGRTLSEAWWRKTGRKNMTNRDFNYTGWYMNMKNRFGWADNTKEEKTVKKEVTQTIIERKIIKPNE